MSRSALPLLLAVLLGAALTGCDRGARPGGGATGAGDAAASSAPAAAEPSPPDWILNPQVVAAERAAPPRRFVCAAPNATEICCALGLREQIVGRTRYCDYPPGIETVASIGALEETNVEVLLGLRPDYVLVSGTSRAIAERLERAGVRFESLPDRTLEDVFRSIEKVAALAGRPQTGRQLNAALRDELQRSAARCRTGPPRRVLLLIGVLSDPPAPPFAAGPGSYLDDLLRLAGHENVAERDYGQLSLEAIVRADPDVIIELDADGRGRAGGRRAALGVWAKLGPLKAVTNHQVHVLVGRHLLVPGPRVTRTMEQLCRVLAGEQP